MDKDQWEQLLMMHHELILRMTSLEHAMNTALNKINTVVLRLQYWELKKEKERKDG